MTTINFVYLFGWPVCARRIHQEDCFPFVCFAFTPGSYILFYMRIYFIRISRLKFAKFNNMLRINPRLKFGKECNLCAENL